MLQDILRDNWRAFEVINQPAGHHPFLDPVMIVGAQDAVLILPVLLLALWLVLARWAHLGRRMAAPRGATGERAWLEADRGLGQRIAILGCGGVILALAFNLLLGHFVFEPRPFVSHPTLVHQLISHVADDSFPSDHAAVAGAVATACGLYLLLVLTGAIRLRSDRAQGEALQAVRVSLFVRKRYVPVIGVAASLFIAALTVLLWLGIARVYAGIHYPVDIIVGALCGFVGSVFAVASRPLIEPLLGPILRLAERIHVA
jgi:undecaprenyl-diphosphatase